LAGLKAVQNVGFDIREGMILGHHRSERRRQDHAVQSAQRFLRSRTRAKFLLDGRNMIGPQAPMSSVRPASGRTFQIMRPFPRMSVRDNVRVGSYVQAASEAEARPSRR